MSFSCINEMFGFSLEPQTTSIIVWVKQNALETGTQIRRRNNIQMVSLHDDDTAFAKPALSCALPLNFNEFTEFAQLRSRALFNQRLIISNNKKTVAFC